MTTLLVGEKSTNVRADPALNDRALDTPPADLAIGRWVVGGLAVGVLAALGAGALGAALSETPAVRAPAALAGTAAWIWVAVALGADTPLARLGSLVVAVLTFGLAVAASEGHPTFGAAALGVHAFWSVMIRRFADAGRG